MFVSSMKHRYYKHDHIYNGCLLKILFKRFKKLRNMYASSFLTIFSVT